MVEKQEVAHIITCKNGNTYKNYRAYIQSKDWRATRQRYRRSKLKWKCYMCGYTKGLHLHHKSYKTLGRENLNHLIPLCETCHKHVHRYLKEHKSNKCTLWTVAKKLKFRR